MGWWQIGTDTLAGSGFVLSPLAETVASLKTLHAGAATHPGERGWLVRHLPAYRERLAAEPLDALLVRAAIGPTWNADFLTPTPLGDRERSFEEEVEAVRATGPADAVDQLAVAVGGPVPEPLRSARDLPERLAGVLGWVWRETVRPEGAAATDPGGRRGGADGAAEPGRLGVGARRAVPGEDALAGRRAAPGQHP